MSSISINIPARGLCLALTLCLAAVLVSCGNEAADSTAAAASDSGSAGTSRDLGQLLAQTGEQWQFLDDYCMECHNQTDWSGKLAFDLMDPDHIHEDAETWEKVARKLRGNMMPPPGQDRPETARLDEFTSWLENTLDVSATTVSPGNTVLHRLNRTEYAHAVKALLDLDVDPAALLPVDTSEDGFDNIASALHVSPSFIDLYLSAARNVSAQAVGEAAPKAISTPYTISSAGQLDHVEGLPFGTRGGGVVEHYFPADGEYLLSIGDLASGMWVPNQEHVNTVIATVDGKKILQVDIGGGDDLKAIDQLQAPAVGEINSRLKNIPFVTTAGPHKVAVTFLHRSFAESDSALQPLEPGGVQDKVLRIRSLDIYGPVNPAGISQTPSREKIFVCYPKDVAEEGACSRDIVTTLAKRAFRGFASDDDIARFMQFYEIGYAQDGFEEGIEYALSAVLAHPKFLYRLEEPPEGVQEGSSYRLGSMELASRLSFFLWSSPPDAELMQVAADNGLQDPEILEQQVRRMLQDPRSATLASNFAYQWLNLGALNGITPDPVLFADVANNLREDLIEETRLFIDSIFRADQNVLNLLTASHTYLNQNLALHYGINDIRGDHFRRVELADENRWGLLGKGSVLMASSYPNRTSPVLRGAWVLENLMGTPPAAPPPNVEGLVENIDGEQATSVRDRLEAHRANPSCNGCHGVIDPLGFALENFDAVGRWREKDREAGTVIDASGVMPGGHVLTGPADLREALVEKPEQFVRTLIEKLMAYGLGRGIEYQDMPVIRAIAREAAAQDYRFSAIILGIIESDQFQMRYLPDPEMVAAGPAAE